MCINIRHQRACVPAQIEIPIVHRNVIRRHSNIVLARDVVLRADMHEAQRHGRQPRDRVVQVRDPVVAAGLAGDVVADFGAADARGAVGVLSSTC